MDTDERLRTAEQRIARLEELVSKLMRLAEAYPAGRVALKALGLKS